MFIICYFELQVPAGGGGGASGDGGGSLWGEEEVDLIRSCAALSAALGLQKSFSTSDISDVDTTNSDLEHARQWASEVSIYYSFFSSKSNITVKSNHTKLH